MQSIVNHLIEAKTKMCVALKSYTLGLCGAAHKNYSTSNKTSHPSQTSGPNNTLNGL